jgi:hypothetical protein
MASSRLRRGLWVFIAPLLALTATQCGSRSPLQELTSAPADAGMDAIADAKIDAPVDAKVDAKPDSGPIPGLGDPCDGIGGNPVGCAQSLTCWQGDPEDPEDQARWPGGYCTLECVDDSGCAAWGGVCAFAEFGQGLCMKQCDVPKECRQGYACIKGGLQTNEFGCVPTGFIATRGPGEACFQHDDPQAPHYLPPPAFGFGPSQQVDVFDVQGDEVVLAVDGQNNVVVGANVISSTGYQNPAFWGNGQPPGISFTKNEGPADGLNAYYSDPNVVVGKDGTFHYSTLGINPGDPEVRLLIARSTNAGASWTTVHANPPDDCTLGSQPGFEAVCMDHPWLAIGPDKLAPANEALYAAYLASPPNDFSAVLLRSVDGGTTWGTPGKPNQSLRVFSYSELGAFVNLITPSVDESGNVHMVACGVIDETKGSPLNSIYYSRTEDGGKTRTPPIVVNPPGESIPFNQPVIATDSGRIWVAYTRGAPDGAWDIVLAKSDDQATSFSYEVVNDEPEKCATHFYPALAVDRNTHRVYVGWYDGRYAPYEGYVMFSVCDPTQPGPKICSENRAINDTPFYITTDRRTLAFIGDYFGLLARPNGELWAAWGDTRLDFVSHAFVAQTFVP